MNVILLGVLTAITFTAWMIGMSVFLEENWTVDGIIQKEIKEGKPWEVCFIIYFLVPVFFLWAIKVLVLKTKLGRWFFLGEK